MHTCPVCGFNQLMDPPKDNTICPSCGTEFDFDTSFATPDQLRQAWIARGMKWWSTYDLPPDRWNPYAQLKNIRSTATFTFDILNFLSVEVVIKYPAKSPFENRQFISAQSNPPTPDVFTRAPEQSLSRAGERMRAASVGGGMSFNLSRHQPA
jgi:hypothetical protein